jgi:hypothetical protein
MRKNQNSSFYHYCSILYNEDMKEELDRTYFMTLKEMSNYYNVHPSSLGKVIRYKKCLKKIPNTIFKRVYEPVFLKVCNEVKNPKVDMFVEEIDTKPYEEKENHSFKFFEAEEQAEQSKKIENQQEVKVSMLHDYTTTTTLIDTEFDNQMIINMNMKNKKHKKSQNQPANVNIKLVNDIDNLFQQTQSIEQDNNLEATHTETKHTEEPQANQIEDNSIQIEIISKNKPQNRNNDLNVELQYQTQSNSIEEKHTEEPQAKQIEDNSKQIEIISKNKPQNRNSDLNVELQTQSKYIEKQMTNENSIQLKEEQTNYSMINNFSFSNDLTDIDDTLDIFSKKENDIKVEEKHLEDNSKLIEINSKNKLQNRNSDLNVELQTQSKYIEKQMTNENSIQLKEEQTNYSMIKDFLFSNDLTDIDDTLDILSKKENRSKMNSNTQNEFSSYFFTDDIETIIDEKKIEQRKQKQTQKENRSELDIFFEECDVTNKIDINDLSTDELDELDKSNLEEFTPSFF